MGSRREQGLVAVLIICVLALALLTTPDGDSGIFDRRASTFRPAPPGAMALYLALEALDVPVERRLADWVDGPPLRGTLVLLSPPQVLTPAEVTGLLEWVEGGGALIVAAGWFQVEPLFETLGLALSAVEEAPEPALGAVRHAWNDGTSGVEGFEWTFAEDSPVLQRAGTTTLLQTSGAGEPVVVTFARGAGQVVAWSDVGPLTNGSLRDSGAALVFTRAAADLAASQGPLVFDEYHHGYRDGAGPVRATVRFLLYSAPGWMVLQIGAVVIGLLWLYGRRFGAPHDPPPARRRSPLEHVDALAGAYRQGAARATARRLIVAGLARRLGQPVPAAGAEAGWLGQIARRGIGGPHADALHAEWQRGPDGDLVALARHADALTPERT